VARLLGSTRINVAATSPPYADRRRYDQASDFKPIAPAEYVDWFAPVAANVRRHLAADGSWFVNIRAGAEGGERELYVYDLVIAHKRRWGWAFVEDLLWTRPGLPGTWPNRFKNGHEGIYQFAPSPQIKFRPEHVSYESSGARVYSPERHFGFSKDGYEERGEKQHVEGIARPSNVITTPAGAGAGLTGLHPAEFPTAVPRFLILAYSDEGDVVFDPFAGSGTTLVAAEQTGRAGYGMELSPRYAAIILERLAGLGLVPRLDGAPEGSGHRPYGVLVACASEAEQARVHQQLVARGLDCRPLEG